MDEARAAALEVPVAVIPHVRVEALHAPGVPTKRCLAGQRRCDAHTSDWRAPPGSPGNRHGITARMELTPLRAALARCYATEALLAGYVVTRAGVPLPRQPRVAKDALAWLRAEGYEVVLTALIADWDTDPHVPWTPATFGRFEALWATTAGPLATCGAYLSPRGARLVQPLAAPVPVDEGEARLRTWLRALIAAGVTPRVEDTHDWTRLMRVPRHQRPTGPVRAAWMDLGRMVCVDAPEPAADCAPVRRGQAGRRMTPRASVGAFLDAVPPAWEAPADALGAAIRDTVRSGWRRCYLALSGALLARGCPPEALPAVVGRAHAVDRSYPEWQDLRGDRLDIARTTVAAWVGGQPVLGSDALRAGWPGVLAALDAATVVGAEARVRAQLARPAGAAMPLEDVPALLARTLAGAYGPVLIAAPPGTGKTAAVVAHARGLPIITDRAPPGARVAVSAPTHRLLAQTAQLLPGRSLRLFSPLAHVGPDGQRTCVFYDAASALAAGRQSTEWEFCLGRGKAPCERARTCPARAGQEGSEHANLVLGPHALVGQLRAWAGRQGLLVVDEPEGVVFAERLTVDALETARRFLDAFVPRYAGAIAPALVALLAWVRDLAPVDGPLVSLHDAVRGAAAAVPVEVLAAAGIDPETPAADLGDAILVAAAGAIHREAKTTAPPLQWRAVARARADAARAAELGRASRVLDLLWRGLTCRSPYGLRVGDRGERAGTLVGLNDHVVEALRHDAVAFLDADAALLAPALEKVLGLPPPLVEIHVPDGAPIARAILVCPSATRAAWLPRGVPDWDAGLLTALRAVGAWLAEDPTTRRVGLLAPEVLEVALAHAARPADPAWPAAWKRLGQTARALDHARAVLAPIVGAWGVDLVTAHYHGLEGLNLMADCDATVTLVDPRPNIGDVRDAAEYLGLEADGLVDALAAAELGQAHGRLRTIHRTRTGRQLHVGTVVPKGWQGLPVDVRRLPTGRPRTVAAMTAEAFRQAREDLGMGLREFARALKVGPATATRYERGDVRGGAIPEDVARAVRALVPSVPQTPSEELSNKGFVEHPFVPAPLQGVCGTPAEDPATGGLWNTPFPVPWVAPHAGAEDRTP